MGYSFDEEDEKDAPVAAIRYAVNWEGQGWAGGDDDYYVEAGGRGSRYYYSDSE